AGPPTGKLSILSGLRRAEGYGTPEMATEQAVKIMPTGLFRRVPYSSPASGRRENVLSPASRRSVRITGRSRLKAGLKTISNDFHRGAAMSINGHKMKGAAIIARDGSIGEVEDVYFDDEKWTVRYLVVKAGAWLFRRHVLISPISIKKVDEANNQVIVNLTRDQVK